MRHLSGRADGRGIKWPMLKLPAFHFLPWGWEASTRACWCAQFPSGSYQSSRKYCQNLTQHIRNYLEIFRKKKKKKVQIFWVSYNLAALLWFWDTDFLTRPSNSVSTQYKHKCPHSVYGKQKQEISCSCIDQSHDHTKQRLPWFLKQHTEIFTLQ